MSQGLLEDLAAVLVALAALTTSVVFGVMILRQDRRRRREAFQRQFARAIEDLSDVRSLMLATDARALDDGYDPSALGSLVATYAEKISLHISRATELFHRHDVVGAPADHLVLASALAEQGRIAEAGPHYEIARKGARDKFASAELGRMYGRAVYMMGNVEAGRRLIQHACDNYLGLAASVGYDKSVMLAEFAETHRRLFELEWRQGEYARAMTSLSAIKSTRDNMTNPSQKARLTRMICDVAGQLQAPVQARAGGALALVEAPARKAQAAE